MSPILVGVQTLSDGVTNEIDEVVNQFFSIFFFDIKIYFAKLVPVIKRPISIPNIADFDKSISLSLAGWA